MASRHCYGQYILRYGSLDPSLVTSCLVKHFLLDRLSNTRDRLDVTIIKDPEHRNKTGNESADELARKGSCRKLSTAENVCKPINITTLHFQKESNTRKPGTRDTRKPEPLCYLKSRRTKITITLYGIP